MNDIYIYSLQTIPMYQQWHVHLSISKTNISIVSPQRSSLRESDVKRPERTKTKPKKKEKKKRPIIFFRIMLPRF